MSFTTTATVDPMLSISGSFSLGEADLEPIMNLIFTTGHEADKDLLLKLIVFKGKPFLTDDTRAQAVADVFKLVEAAQAAAAAPKV